MGRLEGHGIFTRVDKRIFEGNFKDNRSNGYSTVTQPDVFVFEGLIEPQSFTYIEDFRYNGMIYTIDRSRQAQVSDESELHVDLLNLDAEIAPSPSTNED